MLASVAYLPLVKYEAISPMSHIDDIIVNISQFRMFNVLTRVILNPAELFVFIYRYLKLELLTQFPALNNDKYFYF